MPQISAGILLHRRRDGRREVLLVHPGGPFWVKKDEGAWSVPKGLVEPGEEEFACARREFHEETGFQSGADSVDLGYFRLTSGKRLHIWAVEGDCDPAELVSNTFEMEWPPRSEQIQRFPEVDRCDWFCRQQALIKITKGQRAVLEAFFARFADS